MGSCEWICGPELVIRHNSQALHRWEKDQILRNPGHTKAEVQSTLLYFMSDIIHSLLCSNLQPKRSTEHVHTLCSAHT